MKKGDSAAMNMKVLLLAMAVLFLVGCGATVRNSEFYDHQTHYKSFDHLRFSWWGHKDVTKEDVKNSTDENWWGLPVMRVENLVK